MSKLLRRRRIRCNVIGYRSRRGAEERAVAAPPPSLAAVHLPLAKKLTPLARPHLAFCGSTGRKNARRGLAAHHRPEIGERSRRRVGKDRDWQRDKRSMRSSIGHGRAQSASAACSSHDANGCKSRRRVGWRRDAPDPATFRKRWSVAKFTVANISFLRDRYLRAAAPRGLFGPNRVTASNSKIDGHYSIIWMIISNNKTHK
jgi:hypothetical protein